MWVQIYILFIHIVKASFDKISHIKPNKAKVLFLNRFLFKKTKLVKFIANNYTEQSPHTNTKAELVFLY